MLQGRKSSSEGKSIKESAKNSVESVYHNAPQIFRYTPVTKSAGISANYYITHQIEKGFGGTATLRGVLKSRGGKFLAYGSAAYAWAKTIYSVFCRKPAQRARKEGYRLK